MRRILFISTVLLVLTVVACGGDSAPAGGDTAAGKAVFAQGTIGSLPGCTSCHSLEPGVNLVGPSLANVGAEAGSRATGLSAEEYVRQSIVAPSDYVVDGYGAGIMPAGYKDQLTDQQLEDLAAYLLSLK